MLHVTLNGRLLYSILTVFFLLFLAGCKPVEIAEEMDPAYNLAQGCYLLQNRNGEFLVATDSSYFFVDTQENQAEVFYLKPTRLGSFLLYDRNKKFFARDALSLSRHDKASVNSEWKINFANVVQYDNLIDTQYTLKSEVNNLRLQIADEKIRLQNTDNSLYLNAEKTAITFIQQSKDSCTQFPEAALNALVDDAFYQEKDPDDPIFGYADVHTHIGFPKSMASLAMSGDVFHPYGIEHALHDCAEVHGKNGVLDFLEGQNSSDGSGGHETSGYPDFSYWPRHNTNTHVQAYYRWIQRAHLSGLRIMVTLVTGNPSFCQMLGIVHFGKAKGGCTGNDAIKQQTEYLYAMEDYIDAQEGGPGKGWFRIVKSPVEARIAIAKNQLAVVLGIEHVTLFNCDENFGGCTEDYIDQQLDEIFEMGIRSVFPIHRFDNAFGGTMPASGDAGSWMHLTGMMSTSKIDHIVDLLDPYKLLFKKDVGGHFWDMGDCPEGAIGTTGISNMQDFLDNGFSFFTGAVADLPLVSKIVDFGLNSIFLNKLEPVPDYEYLHAYDGACNQRELQPIGAYLINRMIDKGMILEIDHLSYATFVDTMEILETRQYSGVISSHGWLDNSLETRGRILSLGGLLSTKGTPSSVAESIAKYEEEMESYDFALGLGMGSDVQGVASQPGADSDVNINYPFTSIDGLVTFTEPTTGDRTFDYAAEGIAHYGLYAEWTENLRQVDERRSNKIIDNFMNSAEAYVQMWERAAYSAQH